MTAVAIALCVVCQFFLVIGQLLLKRAINASEVMPRRWPKILLGFSLAIGCLTAWFFLWVGLMGGWELSRLFPFEGLNPALLAIAAWFFLKEKLSWPAWVGIGLISAGIGLVIAN